MTVCMLLHVTLVCWHMTEDAVACDIAVLHSHDCACRCMCRSVQDRVGKLEYLLRGVYPAEHFFTIDRHTGEVYVIASLRNDHLQLTVYVLDVVVYDTAYPEKTNSLRITISGTRLKLHTCAAEAAHVRG